MAKKTEAETMLREIPEGGYAISPSGGTKIIRGSDEEATGFRWISGKTEKPIDEDGALKNLMRIKTDVLAKWTVVGPDQVAEDERERAAKDEAVRERVGLKKAAQKKARANGGTSKKSTRPRSRSPRALRSGQAPTLRSETRSSRMTPPRGSSP